MRGALRQEADVWVYNTQVPAALAGRAIRKPYVVITDVTPLQYDEMAEGYGHRTDRLKLAQNWKHRVNRRVFADAAACVPWSTWVADSLAEDYGIPIDRIEVIPPGVDTGVWLPGAGASDTGRFRVLFVGGDFERKGGETLLQVLPLLDAGAELHIVTQSELPQAEGVRVYRDFVPNDPRLLDLYARSDVFALPTRAETFGIAAVEASATGLPVIASRVGGLSDIVLDGQTGFLHEPGDVKAFARSLLILQRDIGVRQRLGIAARGHAVTNFDASANAARLFQLISEAGGRSPQ